MKKIKKYIVTIIILILIIADLKTIFASTSKATTEKIKISQENSKAITINNQQDDLSTPILEQNEIDNSSQNSEIQEQPQEELLTDEPIKEQQEETLIQNEASTINEIQNQETPEEQSPQNETIQTEENNNDEQQITEQQQTNNTEEIITSDIQESIPTEETQNSNSNNIVATAENYLGYSYVAGGASPSGFDCSGFTQYVYGQNGITLSRASTSQANDGIAISKDELQAGDLLLFHYYGSDSVGHTGIYIGDGQFIHAANSNRGVVIDSIESGYYYENYAGARRVQ